MTRVGLVCSEPIRARMAGIGIRYLEFARRLPRAGLETVLICPAASAEVPGRASGGAGDTGEPHPFRVFERGRLRATLAGCDAVVAQGQLANDVVVEVPELPVAIDLYDPWLVENLHYASSLGMDPYRNDHASWALQMSRGDFFLCSSEEQRLYYLGFLTAAGRVNPERMRGDPDFRKLIAPVPFGVPETLPAHRPYLPPRAAGERRILFGGLYDWYDPWPLLTALERLRDPGVRLLLIRNPNPEGTPQELWSEVESWCRQRGLWEAQVVPLDWVPADRRYDLLREVDLVAATHAPGLETELSLRTRFLDAAAAGCPVVVTEGGTVGRLVREHGAGWVVSPGAPDALVDTLRAGLADASAQRAGALRLAREFAWERVLAPLVEFCSAPERDPTKDRFAQPLPTAAPKDGWGFRARRWLRRRGWLPA